MLAADGDEVSEIPGALHVGVVVRSGGNAESGSKLGEDETRKRAVIEEEPQGFEE